MDDFLDAIRSKCVDLLAGTRRELKEYPVGPGRPGSVYRFNEAVDFLPERQRAHPVAPKETAMTIRVLIVDDQSLIRSGLRSVLEAEDDIAVVAEAADGAEAVSTCQKHRPDVVIMDLRMPRIGGVEATVRLMRLDNPPKVLALTTFNTDDLVIEALKAGAAGFLLKNLRSEELIAAVRTVAVGGTVMSPEITAKLVSRAHARMPAGAGGLQEKIDSLKDGERDVLALIGAGYTNQRIAEELHLSLASVKTYASRMLARLGLENRTQAAILAYEAGLVVTDRNKESGD
ncbi:response regulator transcription factor [Streptomyces sp. NPDC002536]